VNNKRNKSGSSTPEAGSIPPIERNQRENLHDIPSPNILSRMQLMRLRLPFQNPNSKASNIDVYVSEKHVATYSSVDVFCKFFNEIQIHKIIKHVCAKYKTKPFSQFLYSYNPGQNHL
jgi:hypothetical protein